jgi:hypothetical protein
MSGEAISIGAFAGRDMEIVVILVVAGLAVFLNVVVSRALRSRIRRAAGVAVMFVPLYAALGCSFSEDKKEAEHLAEQYFAKVQSGDIEGVLSLYSARFYDVTSRADWFVFLQNQRARCGTPKTHSLTTWNVFSSIGTNSGTRTTLVYDVQYSSCRVSEKMIIFKPSGGKIQIQGHLLKPEAGNQNNKGESQATLLSVLQIGQSTGNLSSVRSWRQSPLTRALHWLGAGILVAIG